jgi:hypothetical protein
MKLARILPIVMLALLFTASAFGDSIDDPKIIIHGANGGDTMCPPQGCRQVGMHFTFSSPAKGFGELFFTNASGKNWTSLKLIETGEPAADITCIQSLFLSCKVETLRNGSVEILLSGINKGDNPRNGIPAGSSFVIGFVCQGQGHCWPKGGINFTATAFAVPEPGTIALLATGVVGIYSRRKRWLNRAA